jgi:probable phosphoglycerate mutase
MRRKRISETPDNTACLCAPAARFDDSSSPRSFQSRKRSSIVTKNVAPVLHIARVVSPKPSPWPTHLWLVRHGESAGNLALIQAESTGAATIQIEGRDVDVPLSALGERQSLAVGRWFGRQAEVERPSVILTSPYLRALQTSKHIAHELEARHVECVIDERLREKEFGELNRFTKAGILAQFPEEARRRSELGKFYYRPPGGESWCDVALRLRSVLQDLQLSYAGERLLIVAHQVVVLCLRYLLERLDEQRLLDIDRAGDVANCSITTFRATAGPRRVQLELRDYNFVAPLEEAGATVTATPDPAALK